MIFALITNNIVTDLIEAHQRFIDEHPELCDVAIGFPCTDSPYYPSIGDIYDPVAGTFTHPIVVVDDQG